MIAWSSTDGVTWTQEAPGQSALTTGMVIPYAVIDAGNLLLAAGLASEDPDAAPSPVPAFWTSADAVVWQRVPHDPAVFGEAGMVGDLDVAGGQVIALGEVGSPGPEGDLLLAHPVVWQSEDAVHWSRAFDGPQADLPTINQGYVGRFQGAAAAPDGSIVVVGGWCEGDVSTCTAAVWRHDAGGWQRVAHDPEAFKPGTFMMDVTSGPDGLVAVGMADLGAAAAVWTSPDGTSWTLESDHGPTFERTGMTSVIRAGGRYLAVGPGPFTSWCGGCMEGDRREPIAVWTSTDGRRWDRFDLDHEGWMLGVANHGGRTVAVGQDWDAVVGLWVNPAPGES
jgi:hypothetical protein